MTEWLEEAQQNTYIDLEEEVWIDQLGVNFHDPDNLQSSWDMSEAELGEAAENYIPCSKCYPTLHSFYKTHESLTSGEQTD